MLIAFAGKMRSGKDTCARYVVERYGGFPMAFADPIKDAISTMFCVGRDFLESHKDEPDFFENRSIRYLLQTLGTEWGREMVHPDIWVSLFKHRYHLAAAEFPLVVCTDVRFQNEVDAIHDLGGKVVLVVREGFDANNDHVSENSLAGGWDVEIRAKTGELDQLLSQVDDLVQLWASQG